MEVMLLSDAEVGRWLKRYRERHGLSQKELAAVLHRTQFAGDWWKFNGEDAQRVALEPERSDRDEILVTLRGLDGEAGPGSFYLTSANASDLADQLRREVLKKWKP